MYSQYTGVINSNRPGFSESPYSVGTGVYQLEINFFYRKGERLPTFSRPEDSGIDLLLRTSFFKERLEFGLDFSYQNDQIAFQNIFSSNYYASGISGLFVGTKYLVYEQKYTDKSKEIRSWKERFRFDWKRLIPSVAAYAGVHTGIADPIFNLYENGGFSPKVGILLQNDLTSDLNIITNIYYDRITTSVPELSYIITATYSLNGRWSTFFENQTISNKYRVESNIGSGIAFLWNRNLQINTSLRIIADGRSQGFYASFGTSYRLDRHIDKYTEIDEFGNPVGKNQFEKSGKNRFFSRFLDKIMDLFNKKGKTSSRSRKLKEKSIESIRRNTSKGEQTINNYALKKVTSKPIRTKPRRIRVKPTKYKEIRSNKKKGLFGVFKGKPDDKKGKKHKKKEDEKIKKMSQKDVDRELKKLDKKQEKLEKEMKKKGKNEERSV